MVYYYLFLPHPILVYRHLLTHAEMVFELRHLRQIDLKGQSHQIQLVVVLLLLKLAFLFYCYYFYLYYDGSHCEQLMVE